MSYPLFSDSSTVVNLEPEYGFEDNTEKIQSTMRTQAGGLIQYKFSQFPKFKIPVKYINATDKTQLNTWWANNTDLVFTFASSDFNVRITNKNTPIDRFTKPYVTLYEGTIELEGY